ncbi:efflux RND transporter periplasmic adaptor subunit [Flavobacterium celericrescens]|uniref:Efflux RND transporter periplasmic adaptor subunit n=1 Tax=Flavobacterium celericrescens TaxID=2709780 RepID=A0ABX0I7T2_9FLAO|nr:efflux RND transporter periplasmic adaptor subunit [Flavobacterium celericrescens]NHM03234.1 efflux RND transporter periplasmic adaptor subunit [Flavobacterium celericrescens]
MKKIIYIVLGVGIVGAAVVTLMNNKKQNEADTAIVAQENSSVAVRVATVETNPVEDTFFANGNFSPDQELEMAAERSGKVISVLVKEGDRVAKGQTIAIIRGDVVNVEAETANANYQNALNDYNRFESAYKTGGVTKQQLDQARINMINAKSRLTQANINVGDTRVKAPFGGIINKKFIEVGAILSAMPPTKMFEIVNTSSLKLKVNVSERQVAQLKIGSVVKVKASVFPDKEYTGKVTFIASKADTSLNFPIEVAITNNANNEIKAGMYGSVVFGAPEGKQPELMTIPRSAFVGSVSSNQVYVVEKDIAVMKKVVAGRVFGDKVEILSGLNNGDVVVTSGQINLSDSTKVSIVK